MSQDLNTTDPDLKSWIDAANAKDAAYPIQLLPWGAFHRRGSTEEPRLGVPIGDRILELRKVVEAGVMKGVDPTLGEALCATSLNPLLELGPAAWSAARTAISEILRHDCPLLRDSNRWRKRAMVPLESAVFDLPARIGSYTDFYASINHATNVGAMFRPDQPLMPNWKHLPVGYHGRASSIVVGGTPVRRPMGQIVPPAEPKAPAKTTRKTTAKTAPAAAEEPVPVFGPVRALDYELELGLIVGLGNALGTRIPIAEARRHMFGVVLVNDWSARDVQRWEYQPLGPFNGKNFATSISPLVIQMEALAPFETAPPKRAKGDPKPLDYLHWKDDFGLDITLEVLLSSAAMREKGTEPMVVASTSSTELYWTFAQMLAHHTSTGCNLQPGDLIASGTISGGDIAETGSLLERTKRGEKPIKLPDGTTRAFLQDGDEVILRASCAKRGARSITLGECRGIVLPAE